MSDILEVEILHDGTLKITSGKVSMANHRNAEAFLAEMARELGGKTERKARSGHAHQHHHHDDHHHNHS